MKKTISPPLLSPQRCKELANMIQQFNDPNQLYNECKHNSDMAIFCGVKQTDSPEIIKREAIEQWNVCRKIK